MLKARIHYTTFAQIFALICSLEELSLVAESPSQSANFIVIVDRFHRQSQCRMGTDCIFLAGFHPVRGHSMFNVESILEFDCFHLSKISCVSLFRTTSGSICFSVI